MNGAILRLTEKRVSERGKRRILTDGNYLDIRGIEIEIDFVGWLKR